MAKRDYARAIQTVNNTAMLTAQHLEYALSMEGNRAILTRHALGNTEYLMNMAAQIAGENPAATGALKEIMEAYLDATTESIRVYGKPLKYR